MIYGVEAFELLSASPPITTAPAVHFDGNTSLMLPSFGTQPDNGYFSFAGWFNTDWTELAFTVDAEGNNGPNLTRAQIGLNLGGIHMDISNTAPVWQSIIGTADANESAGSKIIKAYVNDVDSSNTFDDHGHGAFNIIFSDLDCWIGDDGSDHQYIGDMCDLSIWPGISFLHGNEISEDIRRLFISAEGKRVDPSVAIEALHAPAVMLTGDASEFPSNVLGTAGSFSTNAGALTNASSGPPS